MPARNNGTEEKKERGLKSEMNDSQTRNGDGLMVTPERKVENSSIVFLWKQNTITSLLETYCNKLQYNTMHKFFAGWEGAKIWRCAWAFVYTKPKRYWNLASSGPTFLMYSILPNSYLWLDQNSDKLSPWQLTARFTRYLY